MRIELFSFITKSPSDTELSAGSLSVYKIKNKMLYKYTGEKVVLYKINCCFKNAEEPVSITVIFFSTIVLTKSVIIIIALLSIKLQSVKSNTYFINVGEVGNDLIILLNTISLFI